MTKDEQIFYYKEGIHSARGGEHPDMLFQSFWNTMVTYTELSLLCEVFKHYKKGVLDHYKTVGMFENYDNGSI